MIILSIALYCKVIINQCLTERIPQHKAWFSYVGKILDNRGFYFLLTVPDFANVSDNRHKSVPQQCRGLVMSEIHSRLPRQCKFDFSFIRNHLRPSQKSGTRRENRNAPDSPDLSPSIPDDQGYLRFRVFISRQNLGQAGNRKIPDHLGFSWLMKTRLKASQLTGIYLDHLLRTCTCISQKILLRICGK